MPDAVTPTFSQAKERGRAVARVLPLFLHESPTVHHIARMTGLSEKAVCLGLTWLWRAGLADQKAIAGISGYEAVEYWKTAKEVPLTLDLDLE